MDDKQLMDMDMIRATAAMVYKKYVAGTDHEIRLTMEDLVHVGVVGYLDGHRRLRDTGTDERVFLRYRVKGAMLDMLRKLALVRMPRGRAVEVKRLRKSLQEAESKGEESTARNSAAAERALAEAPKIVFADQHRDNGTKGSLLELLPGEQRSQLDQSLKKEIAFLIGHCLESLEVERRLVLTARYLEEMSLQDLATGFSCTPQAIHYREKQALSEMRRCLENNGWQWDGSEEELFQ